MIQIEINENKIKAPLKGENVWLILSPEEEVRQKYICRLVNTYGFSLEQIEQDFTFDTLKNHSDKIKTDIVVWRNIKEKEEKKNPIIFIECKSDTIVIRPEDFFKGVRIAKSIGADFFVATNIKQTKIFSKVFKISNKGVPNELINIPTFEQAQSEKSVKYILSQTNEFARVEFSKTLFRCHNIIRNNDKLSPEAAFDEISKILFIKTLYERSNNDGNIFTKDIYEVLKSDFYKSELPKDLPFYQYLFNEVKENLSDDDLFELNELIRVRENSFETIIEELQIYNLSTTSDDVKGIAFEQFLGKTFRGELGQFFTPRTIVDFMVEVLDPQESEIMCDPCCGSGGFLIKAFEYVRSKIEDDIHIAKEKIKTQYYDDVYETLNDKKKELIDDKVTDLFSKLNAELDINNTKSRIRELSYNCIFGTDANTRMSRTAKMNMIMHGDGHGGVHQNDGLLNVNGIFENRFDIILTNPPFGSRVEKTSKITEADKYTDAERIKKYQKRYGTAYDNALKQVNDNIGKPLLNLYKTGSMSTLTEVLFIERGLNLLKPGGRMGIVLPEGVLNNTNLQKIRDFVESRAKILLITSIPQDVFIASGAMVKPSLLFFKKFTEDEVQQWESIAAKAEKEITEKYEPQTKPIQLKLNLRGKDAPSAEDKKILKTNLKQIEDMIISEVKTQIKTAFNYQIPIAEVEKAGISSTGSQIENELEPLAKEFKVYRESNELWKNKFKKISYEILDDDKIYRMPLTDDLNTVAVPEIFYGK